MQQRVLISCTRFRQALEMEALRMDIPRDSARRLQQALTEIQKLREENQRLRSAGAQKSPKGGQPAGGCT